MELFTEPVGWPRRRAEVLAAWGHRRLVYVVAATGGFRAWPQSLKQIESHIKHVELSILNQHRKEIERLVKEVHLTPEQALESLINDHPEEMRQQFHKEEPGLWVTITIGGKLTYSKELLEHLKP